MSDMLEAIDEVDFGDLFAGELFSGSAAAGLDALIARAYPDGGWGEYREWIEFHGNPPDQIERFENAGIIMQPKQLEFCAWARRMDTNDCIDDEQGTPELGIGGARGGAKSFTVFAQATIDDCARFPGCKVLYLRKVGIQAQEQLDDLKLAILGHRRHNQTRGKIHFPNGSRMRIGHFKYEKDVFDYLGLGYEIIIIEEATTLSAKAHKAMRKANRTSMDMTPRIYNSTNPLGVWHQGYKKRFILHERKHGNVLNRRRKFIPTTVEDNKFLNEGYIGNLEDDTGAELRAYRWGDWDVPAGAYFETWDYDLHTEEPITTVPRYQPVWVSMDYGFQHWNMIYFHTSYDGVEYTFHELAHRKHYPSEIAPLVKTALAEYDLTLYGIDEFLAGADVFAKRGEAKKSIVEQYGDLGIKITAALTGPGSRIAGAHHMAKLLGNPKRGIMPTWKITRNCPRLIETIPSLERNPNNPEDVRKVDTDSNGEGGDDAYDGARYGLYRRPKTSYETTTSKIRF